MADGIVLSPGDVVKWSDSEDGGIGQMVLSYL